MPIRLEAVIQQESQQHLVSACHSHNLNHVDKKKKSVMN